MLFEGAGVGSQAMDEILNEFNVPSLHVPQLCSLDSASPDIFSAHKRKAWKGADVDEARCDFAPDRLRITIRSDVCFISLWKKSLYGRTLTEIKADDAMVGFFAQHIAALVRSTLGEYLSPEDFAIVTTPKRRHKQRNFASLISADIAAALSLPFFEDCAYAPSKHRVGTVFTANNIPPQRNVIVFDDFVTTGQTLASMKALLHSLGKNTIFFAGINNKI